MAVPTLKRSLNLVILGTSLVAAAVAGCSSGDSPDTHDVVQAVAGDFDDDGIADDADLDDDNDGILDQVECPVATLADTGFWMFFQNNYYESVGGGGGSCDAQGCERQVLISGAPGTVVTVADQAPATIGASAFYKTTVTASGTPYGVVSSGNAFRVTADQPIQVFGNNFTPQSVDAFTVVPDGLLGTEYVAVGYPNSIFVAGGTPSGQVTVVATQDNTSVTIGALAPIMMDAGDNYTYQSASTDPAIADLTGLLISADKPIAVNAGDICLNTGNGACDHVEESLFPVNAFSSEFFVPKLPQDQDFRVVAAYANTVVKINGAVVATLNAGQFYTAVNGFGLYVQTSLPSEAYIIAKGDNAGTGDPAFVLLPGAQNGVGDATFSALSADNVNVVVVSMPTSATASLMLDGAPVVTAWTLYPGNNTYSYATIPLAAGTHRLTAAQAFTPLAWGERAYESYGYVAGFSFPAGECELDTDGDGIVDSHDLDSDGDGISDVDEAGGTDADGDGIADGPIDGNGVPGSAGGGLTPPDTDGDGILDPVDKDSDNDGVEDDVDSARLDSHVCRDLDSDTCDDCSVTGADESGGDVANDGTDVDADGVCDAGDPDRDNDGVANDDDLAPNDPSRCRDVDTDGCDDCSITMADGSGGNVANDGLDLDNDGQCDVGDTDLDGDGVANDDDNSPTNPNRCRDVDADSCDDCSVTGADGSGGDVANDGADVDSDGICDGTDDDSDNDGVPDDSDVAPNDPTRCRDLDSDTCDDCSATGADGSGGDVANDGPDSDADGQCDATDNDQDNDGIVDGTDNCPLIANPDQLDTNNNGVGDVCDTSSPFDGVSVAGGGCSTTSHHSGGAAASLLLIGLAATRRRRRKN